ncbi:MAG: hypothetical protein GEU26_08600 [Nitrososphaeraceae archaeon]|nr:hypothetical protein [Nitrososphaeraceae archaeon]
MPPPLVFKANWELQNRFGSQTRSNGGGAWSSYWKSAICSIEASLLPVMEWSKAPVWQEISTIVSAKDLSPNLNPPKSSNQFHIRAIA